MKFSIKNFFILLLFLTLIVNCTFTTTTSKHPEFAIESDSLIKDLVNIISCEKIKLSGVEKTSNGNTTTELEIKIINGADSVLSKKALKQLGLIIAKKIKTSLTSDDDYETYKVNFLKQKIKGNITKSRYSIYEYQSSNI